MHTGEPRPRAHLFKKIRKRRIGKRYWGKHIHILVAKEAIKYDVNPMYKTKCARYGPYHFTNFERDDLVLCPRCFRNYKKEEPKDNIEIGGVYLLKHIKGEITMPKYMEGKPVIVNRKLYKRYEVELISHTGYTMRVLPEHLEKLI